MSTKTKDEGKKSSSRGVEELRSSGTGCETEACQYSATRQLATQILNSSTSRLFRRNEPGMSMKTKDEDKKSRSREVEESRSSGTGPENEGCQYPATRQVAAQLLNSSTSQLFRRNKPRMSMKTKDEDKKSSSREVEEWRSSGTGCETEARQHPATRQVAPQLLNSSTSQLFRGNEPRMSMKTKDEDKKSRSRGVEELRSSGTGCETEACQHPARRQLAPQLLNSSTSQLFRRNEPGMSMKTKERSQNLPWRIMYLVENTRLIRLSRVCR
jgi:hypothetical protein